jgi:hypothetical protein
MRSINYLLLSVLDFKSHTQGVHGIRLRVWHSLSRMDCRPWVNKSSCLRFPAFDYVVTHQWGALMYCRFFKIPSHGEVDGQSPAWISQRFSPDPARYMFVIQQGCQCFKRSNAFHGNQTIWEFYLNMTCIL